MMTMYDDIMYDDANYDDVTIKHTYIILYAIAQQYFDLIYYSLNILPFAKCKHKSLSQLFDSPIRFVFFQYNKFFIV